MKSDSENRTVYRKNQVPPKQVLFFSSLQHMLLVLALGLTLPVTTGRAAGLSVTELSSYLAAALFSMGLTAILQTVPGKFFGCGYQSLSTCDSAAIAASVLAAEAGGIPLVLGMTAFTGLVKFLAGFGTYRLRKLFPPYVTGTLVFILGLSQVPSSFKNLLGTGESAGDPRALIVAALSFLTMLICMLFVKRLKSYSALIGIGVGYLVSLCTGILKLSDFAVLRERAVVSLPVYSHIGFSFSPAMILPFLIVAIAGVVDNIGDFSSAQMADDPSCEKPDWKSIERGIRAGGLSTVLVSLIGGSTQGTATTNIGIARSAGITSRAVGYLTGALLMLVSFFPGAAGVLSLIPSPVLGAAILFGMCYIMAGGFETLRSVEMDDRKIFTVFLSIGAAASTLVPGLYSFLPEKVQSVLISPMVMGVIVLLIMTLLCRIGQKKKYEFVSGVSAAEVRILSDHILAACGALGMERKLSRKLEVAVSGISEGLWEKDPHARLSLSVSYDELSLSAVAETQADFFLELGPDEKSSFTVALDMVEHIFDSVRIEIDSGKLIIYMDTDV